jgi:carotenoid cleavage dioxygenase-like enzyme
MSNPYVCRKNYIAKFDMTADENQGLVATIKLPEGVYGGEFNMVPRAAPSAAADSAEDDGWLVGFCTHVQTKQSFCMVHLSASLLG